jgi:hypothetical protein
VHVIPTERSAPSARDHTVDGGFASIDHTRADEPEVAFHDGREPVLPRGLTLIRDRAVARRRDAAAVDTVVEPSRGPLVRELSRTPSGVV